MPAVNKIRIQVPQLRKFLPWSWTKLGTTSRTTLFDFNYAEHSVHLFGYWWQMWIGIWSLVYPSWPWPPDSNTPELWDNWNLSPDFIAQFHLFWQPCVSVTEVSLGLFPKASHGGSRRPWKAGYDSVPRPRILSPAEWLKNCYCVLNTVVLYKSNLHTWSLPTKG